MRGVGGQKHEFWRDVIIECSLIFPFHAKNEDCHEDLEDLKGYDFRYNYFKISVRHLLR